MRQDTFLALLNLVAYPLLLKHTLASYDGGLYSYFFFSNLRQKSGKI